jgi:hypothetical protein
LSCNDRCYISGCSPHQFVCIQLLWVVLQWQMLYKWLFPHQFVCIQLLWVVLQWQMLYKWLFAHQSVCSGLSCNDRRYMSVCSPHQCVMPSSVTHSLVSLEDVTQNTAEYHTIRVAAFYQKLSHICFMLIEGTAGTTAPFQCLIFKM